MTRAVRDRILQDVNGDISDHLRNHVHLTNCIHLKNHMHKQSPILGDRALTRDLVVLQRSKSLRDPSASPQSLHSLSVFDLLVRRGKKDEFVSGRRSVGSEYPRETDMISRGSPPVVELNASKPDIGYVNRKSDVSAAVSGRSSKHLSEEKRRMKKEKSGGKSELRNQNVEPKYASRQNRHLKTPSGQLKDVTAESDDAASSHNHVNFDGEVRHSNSLNRIKRRKFRSTRRGRPSVLTRDSAVRQNEMSVASNSAPRGRAPLKYHAGQNVEEHDDQQVSGVPGNGCGMPWNWSRIHNRGKSFLDMAGRSLSCGLSEHRGKKGDPNIGGMGLPDMPVTSENSDSSIKHEGEVLPLLDASGSLGSVDRAAWFHDYSGELGIFADNLMKQETDSDVISEGRSCNKHEFGKHKRGMHQNLSQKYMPRTFRDIIGQPLVVQALSNAISRRKIGLLYLFYGPHGTGKTSCAHIFARALNCQSLEHSKPCGVCNTCIAENSGKTRNVREIGPVGTINIESITELLEHMVASRLQSHYRVFIFDECDSLPPECWNVILKVIDLAPRRVVFILVCSTLDVVPHVIISRCQKFFFPKLKDTDIIYSLQWIATKEGLEIDKEAVKLIASRSDGSLRDAEMTLEQLSLLGKRISLSLVQELVGLISDEKLVDLLDLALSADMVNTVKNLRDIMEFGVEPLALMSQLATIITDILAGSFDFSRGRPKRKFFRRQSLSKDDMERLRQALKTLSEAEKQLRVSTDRMTWLTAAMLQLAPDQQYILPSSSGDGSIANSQLGFDNVALGRGEKKPRESSNPETVTDGKLNFAGSNEKGISGAVRFDNVSNREIQGIWLEMLEKIPVDVVREFMYQEANLVSLSYGAAPTVQLHFNSPLMKSKAERFRIHILQAFESVLGSPVTIEIRYESRKDDSPILLPSNLDSAPGIDQIRTRTRSTNAAASTSGVKSREIIEMDENNAEIKGSTSYQRPSNSPGVGNPNRSLVRGKISLAHVIQQVDGCKQNNGWPKRKAVSIAEKLEQQNLRLESRSRRLRCWNPSNKQLNKKAWRWKMRTRKPRTVLKFIFCGRCLSSR